jgi:hypothetical protein
MEKFRRSKRFWILGIFLLIVLVTPLNIFAQESTTNNNGLNLTTAPVYFDLSTVPGTQIKDKIKLRNNAANPVNLVIEVKKITSGQGGETRLEDPTVEDAFVNWVKFDKTNITANTKEWTEVPFTIDIPKDAAFGYYLAFVVRQDNSAPVTNTPTASLMGAIAIPVLLNAQTAGAVTQGKIAEFKTDSNFYEYLPTKLITTFENQGNIHIKPRGNIFIKDWRGNKVATLDVNQEMGNILPNSKRTFESAWNDSFIYYEEKTQDNKVVKDKNGNPERSLKVRWDKILDLRIGKYTANLVLAVSGEQKDQVYESSVSFWVMPWKILIGAGILAILAIVGLANTTGSIFRKVRALFTKK